MTIASTLFEFFTGFIKNKVLIFLIKTNKSKIKKQIKTNKNKMKDDKFILMGLDDERSRDIADVLSNSTCKKIIDYLSEIKEASEKDISDALEIPLNTAEYNLNKLIKAGLVEKAKNFFWSVKGRKIGMYRLAKKHIVISPKSTRVNMVQLKSVIPVVLIAAIIVIIAGFLVFPGDNKITNRDEDVNANQFSSYAELQEFLNASSGSRGESYESETIMKSAAGVAPSSAEAADSTARSSDYSKTNIQVEGVDEADIVKNDGKYIYTLSGNKLTIVNAYPAESMKIASEINFSSPQNMFVNGDKLIIFEEGYEYIGPYYAETQTGSAGAAKVASGVATSPEIAPCYGYGCGGYSESKTRIYVYDISDRENPKLETNFSFSGSYTDSRMIGDYIYVISSKYAYRDYPVIMEYAVNGMTKSIPIDGIYYFDYYDTNYVFTSINAINLDNNDLNSKVYLTGQTGTVYVSQDNIYLSYQKRLSWKEHNERMIKEVYLEIASGELKDKLQDIADSKVSVYEKQNQIYNLIYEYSSSLSGEEKADFDQRLNDKLEEFNEKIAKESERTVVHKINVDKLNINYETAGDVPGHVLNQFSMDEYDGNFRIATTTGDVWNGNSLNHIYVLDEDLKIIGRIEDIAKGEKIYSARFIGSRAYLVTFKKVDPFFVIDLKNPENPKILGYLKIPGYSDYLHPYDENHIIGIGKEAIDPSEAEKTGREFDFAWYQGIKIALFDVSDVSNPKENAKFVIGDRGSDSSALYDHKAFLFEKEENLLVIPVSVAEIDRSKYADESKIPATAYGQINFQGAYVLNINENEISLRGKITHNEPYVPKYIPAKDEAIGTTREIYGQTWKKVGDNQWKPDYEGYYEDYYYYTDAYIDQQPGGVNYKDYIYDYTYQIQRSLYMDDVLYTISQGKIKANKLADVSEINSLKISSSGYSDYRIMY